MKCWLTVIVVGAVTVSGYAQKTTRNNYTGTWESAASWTMGPPAATANIGNADLNLTINGFITRNGALSFAANNDGEDFIINDTLVVLGNVSFANKAANLRIGANAVFIVFGNLSATNIISVANGGIFIVTGDMDFSPSGQDEYDNPGGGELYVGGDVDGNDDAEGGEDAWDDLADDYPDIYEYVTCGGGPSCILPVKLSYFNVTLREQTVEINWATIMEEDFRKFVVQRSANGIDFEDIGELPGKGFNIYDIKTRYSFVDRAPLLDKNYYRLKAVDLDDSFEYFQVKLVHVQGVKDLSAYPNPSSGEVISFSFNFAPEESDRIILMDQLGVEVYSAPVSGVTDRIVLQERLAPGIYMLKYRSANSEQVTRILVKN